MKILVTGASGNVGAYVVEELIKLNEEIVVAGKNIDKLTRRFGNSVDIVEFDFMDYKTFETALNHVDRIFLMRPPNMTNPKDMYPFLEAAAKKEIKLISFLSLMGIEKNFLPPHYKIEKYIEKCGIPYAHIRPSFFMQNLTGIHMNEIRDNNEIMVPAGKSKTSFIDAADIGAVIAKILSEPNRYKNSAHTLTGNESLNYYEVANVLSDIMGKKITYKNPGFIKYIYHYLRVRKLELSYVLVTAALYLMTRLGTAKAITNDVELIINRKPISIKEFFAENVISFHNDKNKL